MIATLGVSFFALGMYIIIKSGLIKSWLVVETLPGILSARMAYMALPLGIGFLILAFAPSSPVYDPLYLDIWDILFYLCTILSFAFMIWPPKWIKPAWLYWLEREYGYSLDILIEEAQQINRWDWEARVRTREGMQAWIDEIFQRRSEELDSQWRAARGRLLIDQAKAEGGRWSELGEQIKSYVPEHRQAEEEERVRQELQKREELCSRRKAR